MQQEKHTKKISLIILGLISVGLLGILFLSGTGDGVLEGDTTNVVGISLSPGETVSGTIIVTGAISGSYFFEARAHGLVLDSNKNTLTNFPVLATSHWMTDGPVAFSATIELDGLPKGKAYIRIASDTPRGESSGEKFVDVPVIIE